MNAEQYAAAICDFLEVPPDATNSSGQTNIEKYESDARAMIDRSITFRKLKAAACGISVLSYSHDPVIWQSRRHMTLKMAMQALMYAADEPT